MNARVSVRRDKAGRIYAERYSMGAMRWVRIPMMQARALIAGGATLVNADSAKRLLAATTETP